MLKFTVLTENQEQEGLEHEHGLSVWIEYSKKAVDGAELVRILLDAGQTDVFMKNAKRLGIPAAHADFAVLSHAHYDHAGGFAAYLAQNPSVSVYARREGKLADCWSIGEEARYIGIPGEILEKFAHRFIWTDGRVEISPGIWLIPHSTEGLAEVGKRTGMYRRKADAAADPFSGNMTGDDFAHEHSLVFEAEDGLAIFNSCSHGGVANIVEEVRSAFPGRAITAYIGGFHLKAPGSQTEMNCTEKEVEQLGKRLRDLGIRHIYTGHCTGMRGYEILKEVVGECLHSLRTGMTAEIE